MLRVDEHRPCCVLEFAYATFSDTILEMCVYSAKGQTLLCFHTRLAKTCFRKHTIVGMVVFDADIVLSAEVFEGLLCFDRFGYRGGSL
jgi:hypothetical protein